MIIEVEMYSIQCDSCKRVGVEDSDYAGWNDKTTVWEEADNSEWIKIDDKHYCPNCYTIDDDDNITIKEKVNE